jgi:hypothetical protein
VASARLEGVDFVIEQSYAADPDDVARAYTQSALYDLIGEVSSHAHPEVLDRTVDDDAKVQLRIRYRFAAELSQAARDVLDPDRLSWVEHSTHEVARRHTDYLLVPDNYADRVRISATCTTRRGPHGGAVRTVQGSVRVKAPPVARSVESAIVSGLREHLTSDARVVERFLAGSR